MTVLDRNVEKGPWGEDSRATAVTTTRLVIPGGGTLEFDRHRASGALWAVRGGGRTYLTVVDGTWHWHGVCTTREELCADGMVRHVETSHGSWNERYRWTDDVLTEIDGVVVRRDGAGRVIACLPGGDDPAANHHRWLYGYGEHGLTHVTSPTGTRTISLGADGRAHSISEQGVTRSCEYDPVGNRRGPTRSLNDHIDDTGRCWAALDPDGGILHTFVWDGTRCLARIDGAPGAPLAAVFSLDPSATPVRIVTPEQSVRIPRDAYGEGLLAERGVPGLFGGLLSGGLLHLPHRRIDPITGSFCEPDPCDGRDDDPRRRGVYEGPLPAEPAPRSPYEVCRGDPIGRADPTGGVSEGLIVSDLTWSFQNNILSFFGIDWWFNLFASLIVAPFKNVPSTPIEYDFFSSAGLMASDRHGGFGLRRDGIISAITGGRAFTTQHIVWTPDSEYAKLEFGEVIDPGGVVELTHYGTILSFTPAGQPRTLRQSMRLAGRSWVADAALSGWSRHGGVGRPVAPGTLTPWFPAGGLHLDNRLMTTRGDLSCPFTELAPAAVALGDLETRSFLTAASSTGLNAGDRVLVEDGTNRAIANVLATVAAGSAQRVQLDVELGGLTGTTLSMVEISATPASSESRATGAVTNSIDLHGTAATYAANDLLRLTSGTDVTVARIERLEARLPLDRALPTGFSGPIALTLGAVGAASTPVTIAGANLDFGSATRPAIGSTGLVSGGGTDVAVRIDSHAAASQVTLDVALPAAVTSAPTITFRPINAGTVIGTRAGDAEADPTITYTPAVAGAAPDGTGSTLVVRCDAGGSAHCRIVTGAPTHDVAVLDRAVAGASPFVTERFAITGSTISGLTRADVMALAVPDVAPFAAAPAVFLSKVTGDPPTGSTILATGEVVGGVLTITPPTTVATGFQPGRPVLVGSRAAAVRTVRVTATFDRSFDLAAEGLRIVGLAATGHSYLGTVSGAAQLVAEPSIDIGGSSVAVPFPRFVAGDIVSITDRSGANATWHRVGSSSGGRLDLVGGPPLTVADLILVRHVVTVDPSNGGPFLGIDGRRSGTGATSTATFSVWATNALSSSLVVGIIDGEVTHPATVTAAAQSVEITFSETFDSPVAPVSTLSTVAGSIDRYVTTLARDGGVLLLDGAIGTLATGANESMVVVAYTPTGTTTTGTIGPGTLLVPAGEGTEVDRGQSLTDHELTHTLQYSKWGPLWFNIFPMLAMELPGILATDTELPEYSKFLDGTSAAGTGSQWDITIANTEGVPIGTNDKLQVVQGARRAKVEVRAVNGSVFTVRVDGSGNPPVGQVSVRKQQNASVFDGFYAFFDLLTHGGLVNLVAGSTWGGIFWLIGKGFYGLGRAIGGKGDLYAATVQAGGGAITLASEADAQHIRANGRIVVRQGDSTVVRSMTRAATVITLTESVAFTGDVRVAMYDTHDADNAFDWYDYYPGTIDATNPFSVELAPVGDSSLNLAPEDRVTIRYRDNNFNTDVLAVSGTTVELLDPITIVGDERSVRVAKVGSSDPLGNADSAAMVEMGMGWMKWIFDPYGQIEYAVAPQQEWARWLLRVMRWVLGTQNFSLLPFGYLWWGRLFPIQPEHVAAIEQEASEESGSTYSPMGRVYGQRSSDGFGKHRMVVGDVGRYRFWPNDPSGVVTFVERGQLDAPGVHYDNTPGVSPPTTRTMPNRTDSGAGTDPPNRSVVVGSASDPGTFVAEDFTVRDPDPRLIPGGDTLGFSSSDLGHVPVSARVLQMVSTYFAFTRPGEHRVTTANDIDDAQSSVDAFEAERQTLFLDISVSDVTVTIAGQTVDATTPGTSDRVTLVPFQRAAVTVAPNTSRTYRVTVPDPEGPIARVDAGTAIVGVAAGSGVPVEVSRFYQVTNGSYGSGGLAFAGMHLSRELHIPVRRFTVDVVDTLPLRSAPDPGASEISTLAVGAEGFLLVPAPITSPPTVTTIAGVPPTAAVGTPVARVDAPAAAALLGSAGSAFRIRFPAGSPTGEVVLTVVVGVGSTTANITTTFTLT